MRQTCALITCCHMRHVEPPPSTECQASTHLLVLVSFWSEDCPAVRLLPERSRPPLPVYVKELPLSCNGEEGLREPSTVRLGQG